MRYHDIQLTGSLQVTGSLTIPAGTTAQRPANAKSGSIRLNTTLGVMEIYTATSGSEWVVVGEQTTPAPAVNTDIEYLVVAGGGAGGGGTYNSGGGGAGGYLSSSLSSVTSGSSFTVTVGSGGTGAATQGTEGTDSTIAGASISTITAIGGGGGGSHSDNPYSGTDGGSGGGGTQGTGAGGSGTVGQGNDGTGLWYGTGGGGGGAGEAGTVGEGNVPPYNRGSQSDIDGGDGLQSNITGVLTYRAGGGGGGERTALSVVRGNGGAGGGGQGGPDPGNGSSGTTNTGGGGGGSGGNDTNTRSGGSGGSGVAIFAYESSSFNCAGGIVGDAGNGRKYHQFNSSGTFKIGSTSDFQIVTDGLVLHVDATNLNSYPGTGTTWYDLSGNNLDFSMVGTVTYNSEGYFSGWSSSNYFQCNAGWSSYLPTGDNPRTVCALVRRVTGTTYEHVLHYGTATAGQAYALAVFTSNNAVSDHRWSTSNYGNAIVNTNTNYFISTRYHTTTYPGARTQVNDNFYNETDITSNLSTGTTTLRIGSRISTPTETWNGYIYSVMVYNRALTDSELLQNYEAVRTNVV